ncbi:MAG: hydroxyethylthiazole kinase [Acidobacteriota bacterium]
MIDRAALRADIAAIRQRAPLVLSVTNNVVTNVTANALLALGASPAMSHAAPDAAELAGFASAVVLNMGTPAPAYVESMLVAGKAANAAGVPVAFDPVACGATSFRRELAARLLKEVRMTAIRGNASEILFLAGMDAQSKGVDSAHESVQAVDAARAVAQRYGCAVCVSGAVDVIADGERTHLLEGGHPMMTLVTGMGCTATSLVGAFLAVNADAFTATLHAMAVMGECGAKAAAGAAGPGSLQVGFLDGLYAFERS